MESSPGKPKEEIFEINDFTNATPWENFIADIEKVLHQWGLATTTDGPMTDLLSRQHCKAEQLTYAGRKFSMKLEVSGEYDPDSHAHSDDGGKAWPIAMLDMMDPKSDFPPRSHPITRWYGVKEFVLIMPEKGTESLTSQAQAKLMLSSVSVAVANTQCVTPIFIQLQQQWRHLYVGVCVGGGLLTNFDMIHLKYPPQHLTHLSGLLDMFKGSPLKSLDAVQIALRYTYVLKHWSLDDWPVEPLGDVEGDEEIAYWKQLPVGPLSDPVSELHLSAVWPNLSEETIMEHGTHSELQPTQAPLWTVTTHLQENTNCFLSECLQNFLKLCYREETLEQLLRVSNTEDSTHGLGYSQALEKLTNQSVPSLSSPFLSSVVYSASQRLEFGLRGSNRGTLSDKKMKNILKVLFPDVYDLPEDPLSGGEEDRLKSAPQGSLSRQLATTLCIINNDHGLRVLAEVWNEVIQELRYRWDKGILINSLPEGAPDMGSCLLHQKLQMLNCCIRHKKLQEEKLHTPNVKASSQSHSSTILSDSRTTPSRSRTYQANTDSRSHRSQTPSDSGSDEFYEALETQDKEKGLTEASSPMDSRTKPFHNETDSGTEIASGMELDDDRIGALKQCGDLVLVLTGKPLCIPVTQDHTPMTEDMMWEQQSVLAKLGTSGEAAKVRAKMQSTSLLSDMQAFKAANPDCLLDDFVRWYSPRDWIEEDDSPSPPPSPRGVAREEPVTTEGSEQEGMEIGDNTDSKEETTKMEAEPSSGTSQSESGEGKREGEEEEEEEEGWGGEGWGTDDWDMVVSEEEVASNSVPDAGGGRERGEMQAKRLVRGHLSERMLQPDNVWMETWQQATPLAAYRQKRLFDDTKEAEKVLHFFANLRPSELALYLMPLLLHSALERLSGRLSQQPSARVEGILTDVVSLLATIQQPSLSSLPLYQECIGLLSQAERLLAAGHSLRGKLLQGLELASRDMGGAEGVVSSSPEVAVATEVMLEEPELLVKDPLKSSVGVAMRGLLAAQTALQDLDDVHTRKFRPAVPPPSPTYSFPPATWREFLLRVSAPCPAPHSQIAPQRMFCVLQPGSEFRVAGAFSKDINFL